MGLSSLWSQIKESRVKETVSQRSRFSWELDAEPAAIPYTRRQNAAPPVRRDFVIPQPLNTFDEKKQRRKSHNFGFAKHNKSESDLRLKKRRSWFGAKVQADEDVPTVPALPSVEDVRPGTTVTTDDSASWRKAASPSPDAVVKKERRKSIFGTRKRSKSSVPSMHRRSLFGGNRTIESLPPPIPSMPSIAVNRDPGKTPPLDVHQGLASPKSLNGGFSQSRSTSNASVRKKRRSWFVSSNPDYSDDDEPPPIPALIYDDGSVTPTSSVPMTRMPPQPCPTDHSIFIKSPVHAVTRVGSTKQSRPASSATLAGNRRSYTPRNAANGFLKSTTPDTRSAFRHSLLDDGDGGIICLSEEQQREWEKLQHLMDVLERRKDQHHLVGTIGEVGEREAKQDRALFENSETLAALEFGIAR